MHSVPEFARDPRREPDPYTDVVLGGVVHQVVTRLPASPESVGRARLTVSRIASLWNLDAEAIIAALSEIAANAVDAVRRHGGGGGKEMVITVAALADGRARLDVWNPAPPPRSLAPRRPRRTGVRGRGIRIVTYFAQELTLVKVPEGTMVRAFFAPAQESA